MKKAIITLTVVAGIIAAIALPVFAGTDADDSRSEEFPEAGIILNFTPEFEETKGVIVPYGGTDIGDGTGIYETDLIYFALDQDEFDRLSEDSFSEANYAMLVTIISADNGMTFEDINEFVGGSLDPTNFRTVCMVEDCTHFLYEDPDSVLPEGTDDVYLEEFERLKKDTDALFANSEFGKPADIEDSIVGRKVEFETTDIDGNLITSEELFGSHEITMVNIWTSWCGYCIDEMKELEAINGRLAAKDCAVVGILADGDEEDALASGKETLKEKSVTYTNILPPENLNDIFYISGYPTTYFVNREGIIVDKPITGAYIDQYEPAVETLLSGNTPVAEDILSDDETEEEAPLVAHVETNDDSVYRVIAIDEDGNPVQGVAMQFCSDTACMLGETDETGTVVFNEKMGHYTVHILEAPEEYAVDNAEFTLEEFCDLTIILFRS